MFSTPQPRTMVKTRGALEREKLKHLTDEASEALSSKTYQPEVNSKELEKIDAQLPKPGGSLKIEIGVPSKKSSNGSSMSARRKKLLFEAAKAKAEIDKALIDKKLEADLSALDDAESQKSRCSGAHTTASQKVEQWLEKSFQGTPEPEPYGAERPVLEQPAADPPPRSSAPQDFHYLAQAMENLAFATQSTNTQLLSRLATPKDLPVFTGESLEWLQFKKSYEESTVLCKYSDSENIARLNKCLRGEAREAVSSLLISDATPSTILEALQLRFGRPELIIYKIASQFKKLQPLPQAYHTDLVNFAVKVKNYVAAAQSINQTDYLRSPEVLNTVLSKCPSPLINKWADYIYENPDGNKAKLQLLSEFLHQEATKVAAAGISHIHTPTVQKFFNKIQTHSVLNNGSDISAKCKFCRTAVHLLPSCIKFKRALRKDKWRFVKINNLCHKCLLLGHNKEACPAAQCDVEDCGLPHHRLLHWPARETPGARARDAAVNNNNVQDTPSAATSDNNANILNNSATTETVTNTIIGPSTSAMLKIVRVNLHGPSAVIATHALLDDGATISLVSADLADCVNIQGQPETLRIRGAWNSHIVCQSEMVNFKLSNMNGDIFNLRARKISELDLPTQNLSKVKLENYEHLQNLKDCLICTDVKPKLLIGQDNFHLLMTLKTIYRGINEPCATLTPLGWCLHGIVPAPAFARRPLTAEHALTTAIYERASPAAACAADPRSPPPPRAPAPHGGRRTHWPTATTPSCNNGQAMHTTKIKINNSTNWFGNHFLSNRLE
ncbi:uncharacterized protein [Choristoneura fumiferana]|uniref:uncharacterized protein n=1 Tax=Choristoneura fumiferana TaxID=7141 RepID=UPI003D156DAA